jgi:hypothetical protein
MSDDEILPIRDVSASRPSTPATSDPPKSRKASKKAKIKKESRRTNIGHKIKKENPDSQLNVRKSQSLILYF